MVERTPQTQDKYVVRLPDGMRERIRRAADARGHSMNQVIVDTLEKEFPAPIPSADDIMLRIEAVLRHEGERGRFEDVNILNEMLEAAHYPFRVVDEEEGMRLSILPADDLPSRPKHEGQ
ncbi:Arc family DNA-binding protein [Paracoccus siganidrum]|uniref:Arc family DNA-binding protein n=1 Tax=Paracoccus siganidrum TaxID=1276757 RepID=A0A419A4R5_9RHOB|nr:Arc family DNA-binding protein [Paracoccus siganidrum]RJL09435.1 Arc family DNA-binding protein [Paracoccus siganidrum]RMC38997.1 hypothetical protein C9E82_06605 [Paracoccus siganidrum]